MGLFSLLRKNKQEPTSGEGDYYSRSEEESPTTRGRSSRKSNQSNEQVDPVLPEKKRARRRLVGAIALVLAAIIGLPMIFDSEPKQISEDITIQIPSKDKPAQGKAASQPVAPSVPKGSASASVEPKTEKSSVPASSSSAANSVLPAAAIAGGAVAATAMVIAQTKENSKANDASKAASTAKINDVPKTDTKVEPKVVSQSSKISADSARAETILEAKPEKKSSAKNSKAGKFNVQVAALASQEKINELQKKLKAAGMSSHTQTVSTVSGERTRIRVGPFETKKEAESARAKLIKMGLNGTLVPTAH